MNLEENFLSGGGIFIKNDKNKIINLKNQYNTCGGGISLRRKNSKIASKIPIHVISDDLKGLRALKEEKKCKKFYLVSQDEKIQKVDAIEILPWKLYLEMLWANKI